MHTVSNQSFLIILAFRRLLAPLLPSKRYCVVNPGLPSLGAGTDFRKDLLKRSPLRYFIQAIAHKEGQCLPTPDMRKSLIAFFEQESHLSRAFALIHQWRRAALLESPLCLLLSAIKAQHPCSARHLSITSSLCPHLSALLPSCSCLNFAR